ncbi:MAG TPA: ribosome-associated translation inhibitor RaiA [Candidatus Krumholzibacteria bacterium]|jgi:putative sigma-54 modulation protein|nr:ribosome-associated translation inhibitor RaiA [Candidatus Krumholzibacteria bacterium]
MQVSVTGRHYEVTPALRTYIDARLGRLHRYMDKIHSALVTLSAEKHRYRAEIVLHTRGKEFTGKETAVDMYSALDRVGDKLEKQLARFKDRRTTARRRAGAKAARTNGRPVSGTLRVLRAGTVGRTPQEHEILQAGDFPIESLTVDEAILRLEEVDETFVVFANRSSELIHIVFKRGDGNYGVLNLHATH